MDRFIEKFNLQDWTRKKQKLWTPQLQTLKLKQWSKISPKDFNAHLTPMDRSTKQKIIKEIQTLKDPMDQWDLIDIYRTFHPQTMNFTFFSSAHGTYSRIHHILGHKSSLEKFGKIETISSIFSDHNAVRLDVNYKKRPVKNTNIWRLNNMLLNNQQIMEEIKKEIKICIETNENENKTTQTYGTL